MISVKSRLGIETVYVNIPSQHVLVIGLAITDGRWLLRLNLGGLRWRLRRARAAIGHLRPWPAYVSYGGRDCDGYCWHRLERFPTHLHAERALRSAYEWADGPMSHCYLTRADYLDGVRQLEADRNEA